MGCLFACCSVSHLSFCLVCLSVCLHVQWSFCVCLSACHVHESVCLVYVSHLFWSWTEKFTLLLTVSNHDLHSCIGVSPFSGATTGTGGRIRDIQCAGRGSHVIAGTAGYSFGNLLIPGAHLASFMLICFGASMIALFLLLAACCVCVKPISVKYTS